MNKNTWQDYILILEKTYKEKGITQKHLAKKIEIRPCHVSRFFARKHCPSLELYLKMKEAIENF